MCHSGRIYKDLCEAGITENLCRRGIKNAVEVKEYQILYHLRELRQQIGNAKMTNGIFDTERKSYEYQTDRRKDHGHHHRGKGG